MKESAYDSDLQIQDRTDVQKPPRYFVYLLNDDYTTMQFVIYILMKVFNKPQEEAITIMYDVHKSGKGVAGIFTREIAEMKVQMVHTLSRENGHPLRADMEKE
jgi:ATP-dependent Clp protease adaptor protein ClpS